MFKELRNMRMRLTLYYTLVLVLFTSLFTGFAFYNFFYFNRFMLDRELKVTAAQVYDLSILPELYDAPPDKKNIPNNAKHAESLFKFIFRDKNMHITQSSIQYQQLFQRSEELAHQSWEMQKERWDTINLEGIEYRIFSIPFHNSNETGVVQTYCNLTMIQKVMGHHTNLLIAIGMVAVIFAALIGWSLAGRAMMPVRLAWQRQKEFIADISHELRTPLTIIQSNLDVVVADQNGSIKDNITWLQNAYSETRSMGKLINDLLLLARIDSREIKFEHSEFDLSSLLTKLAMQFEPLFQGKTLNFSWTIEPNVKMYGDRMQIKQMVGIFLDNASQYTLDGGDVKLKMRKTLNPLKF